MSSSPPATPDDDGTVVSAGTPDASATKARRKRRTRRRVSGAMALFMGLVGAGFLAAALTPDAQVATAQEDSAAMVREGQQIYDTSCVTCHGANLQGVQDRGPSLIGVGEAAVYFQVSSGRMPMARNEAQAERKPPKYNQSQVDALGAYIQANGGGPTVVRTDNGEIAQDSLRGGDVARGSELFRLNCASCHNFTGRGGALSSGKYAPTLDPANEQQIYQAMVTGPQNMPKFSDRQLTPEEKKDIIAYVKSSSETQPPGGYGLGGFGPGTEAIAIWVVGIGAVVAAALWIGVRS
ncbi:c-type cytochrome [Rhodococcus sp. BP-349]|uniref:Cytochrome bc1 complex cytochrome c subunit n=1 Tax=Rhodococcoides corynebacterioides TaxID=53972 RepID=A0ABS2KT98_9NOCA|nr:MULTISPECIES: cytochrome c [Rhodococcus]MBM7415170.1 ubiquinol-cytochrome c reductase cytochrome c subunit [Rhodococcus corynebacterioides]MBP1117632.1 ubiquinol-cytochrome c reductase cytochrome c subunit [Rhodococcus sp. PvP016]MBY6540703.1 c-type cytochrome [Rhodococcus sp. BP-363]MBY6545272.1 c-type cytochrome [Rhodococcus sp. BP-369]MBY6564502.1 c-type cytochrome [Rhodococcus sp. BP-370]